ncbi:MAG: LuxR family transcriptional regulator, partial [Magnetospirillum sp.]
LEQNSSHGIYQNFYSPAGTATFSPREMENLARLSEVISQCVIRHRDLTTPRIAPGRPPSRDEVARLLADRAPTLAPRELEVCSGIVTGYTTEAIALNLGIAQNSVATYRKRAYAKLGICSQHELFLLCLDGRATPPPS